MYKSGKLPIIAIDFDGTIAETYIKDVGYLKVEDYKLLNNMDKVIQTLRLNNCRVILFTVRRGRALDEAIEFCTQYNIIFDAFNSDLLDVIEHLASIGDEDPIKFSRYRSSKPYADYYYDDKNVGGLAKPELLLNLVKKNVEDLGLQWKELVEVPAGKKVTVLRLT